MGFKLNNPPFPKNTKITKVGKNSINVPNYNPKNKTEAFMHPPYRDPNTKGPTVGRKGYHGWRETDPPTQKTTPDIYKKSGFGPSTAFGGATNPELTNNKSKNKKVMKDGPKTNVVYDSKSKNKKVKGDTWTSSWRTRNSSLPSMARKMQGGDESINKDMSTNTKDTKSEEKKTYELKEYVPGVDGPKYIGGSAPNPAKTVVSMLKGLKTAYNFVTKG